MSLIINKGLIIIYIFSIIIYLSPFRVKGDNPVLVYFKIYIKGTEYLKVT